MNNEETALHYLALPWNWSMKYDSESDCWLATIDELPDFFAAGANAAEAAINAREALKSHIAGYIASGTTIPLPPNLVIGAWSPDEVTDADHAELLYAA